MGFALSKNIIIDANESPLLSVLILITKLSGFSPKWNWSKEIEEKISESECYLLLGNSSGRQVHNESVDLICVLEVNEYQDQDQDQLSRHFLPSSGGRVTGGIVPRDRCLG